MRNKKFLFILIPVLVVVLVLIAGVIFIALNSSPEKIFEHSISKVFDVFENSEDFSTMKGTMDLTASVESDSEEIQAVNDMLEGSSIGLDMQVDTKNMIINEALNVTFNNESLLNASILLQDEKGFVYLPDWLDKYLQIPEEELDYSELTEAYNKTATLDQDALTEAIKEELIKAVVAQELVQEKTTLVLDGKETKVTASTLSLKGEAILTFTNGFLTNLKANEKFQLSLGDYKEDVILMLDEMLTTLNTNASQDVESSNEFRLVIYTKGFLNKFVGVACQLMSSSTVEGSDEDFDVKHTVGMELFRHSDEKYKFSLYREFNEKRGDFFDIIIENKKESKNKGTVTVTIIIEEEQFVVTYNYETQGNKTTFVASTENEGVGLSISGNVTEEGNSVKGNYVISIQEETFGKVNVNCEYDFSYDVEIQRVDIQNSVTIDELSEEDQTTLTTNLQKSKLYNLLLPLISQNSLLDYAQNAAEKTEESIKKEQQLALGMPWVTSDGYTVMYTVPEGFEVSEYGSEESKNYMDENLNSIDISIEYDSADDYISDLDDEYVLTSPFYKNQKISDTKTYDVNGNEYKFRTITYNDEYKSYIHLYFAYELDDEYYYVVEVETEAGKMSMETIKKFLNVTVSKNSIQNAIDSESNLGSGNVHINGEETVNVNDIINIYTSDI